MPPTPPLDPVVTRWFKHLIWRASRSFVALGTRLCWNGKYGGSGPRSVWDIERGATPSPSRTLRAAPAEIQPTAQRVKARVRGPQGIDADDSGSEEELAAGGPGPGAVDPGERGALTDWMMADCNGV